jgi:hypothetical protein
MQIWGKWRGENKKTHIAYGLRETSEKMEELPGELCNPLWLKMIANNRG